MNKGEFIKAIADKSGLTVKDSQAAFESMVAVITETLKAKEKIAIAGFASIELREKAAREGINPMTKQPVKIPASFAPNLKFGKAYKDEFNKK